MENQKLSFQPSRSMLSKVWAWTGQTHRCTQTDTQNDTNENITTSHSQMAIKLLLYYVQWHCIIKRSSETIYATLHYYLRSSEKRTIKEHIVWVDQWVAMFLPNVKLEWDVCIGCCAVTSYSVGVRRRLITTQLCDCLRATDSHCITLQRRSCDATKTTTDDRCVACK